MFDGSIWTTLFTVAAGFIVLYLYEVLADDEI